MLRVKNAELGLVTVGSASESSPWVAWIVGGFLVAGGLVAGTLYATRRRGYGSAAGGRVTPWTPNSMRDRGPVRRTPIMWKRGGKWGIAIVEDYGYNPDDPNPASRYRIDGKKLNRKEFHQMVLALGAESGLMLNTTSPGNARFVGRGFEGFRRGGRRG